MVCSGNICRSPMAAVVAARRAADAGIAGALVVDSAGTGGWHAGDPMDPLPSCGRRATEVAGELLGRRSA